MQSPHSPSCLLHCFGNPHASDCPLFSALNTQELKKWSAITWQCHLPAAWAPIRNHKKWGM